MGKYIVTPLSVAIHKKGESPIFGDGVTVINIEDESGGPFIQIRQQGEYIAMGVCRFNDYDEIATVANVAKELLAAHTVLENDKT